MISAFIILKMNSNFITSACMESLLYTLGFNQIMVEYRAKMFIISIIPYMWSESRESRHVNAVRGWHNNEKSTEKGLLIPIKMLFVTPWSSFHAKHRRDKLIYISDGPNWSWTEEILNNVYSSFKFVLFPHFPIQNHTIVTKYNNYIVYKSYTFWYIIFFFLQTMLLA